MARRFLLKLGSALTVLAAGCGSEAPVSEDAGGSTGGATARFECPPPGYSEPSAPQAFDSLEAMVVDANGAGIPDLRAQACGIDLCLNGQTRPDGSVTITKTQNDTAIDKPAFKYGTGREHAKFAFLLSGGPVYVLGTHTTAALPPAESSVPLVPGTEVASGGVILRLPDEMNPIEVEPFDFDTPELKGFRAVEIPIDQAPPAVDATLGLELLFAMTPVGTELCPFAALRVDNRLGWPPGTPVEVFLHGVEVGEEWAPYGGWVKVSDGQVSDDGATIGTNPDGGIPILSVIGIRRASP